MAFTNALKNYSNNLVECKINYFDNLRAFLIIILQSIHITFNNLLIIEFIKLQYSSKVYCRHNFFYGYRYFECFLCKT